MIPSKAGKHKAIISGRVHADTHQNGFNRLTAGSRTTVSQGMVLVDCARKVIKAMCERAARIWKALEAGMEFANGEFPPAGANVGEFKPLTRHAPEVPAHVAAAHAAVDQGAQRSNPIGAISARRLSFQSPFHRLADPVE
jgi:Molybdopterin-binding domain of aldehyde dehydrogenase